MRTFAAILVCVILVLPALGVTMSEDGGTFGSVYTVSPLDVNGDNVARNCAFNAGLRFDNGDQVFRGTILISGGSATYIFLSNIDCDGCSITITDVTVTIPASSYGIYMNSGRLRNRASYLLNNSVVTPQTGWHSIYIEGTPVSAKSIVYYTGNRVVGSVTSGTMHLIEIHSSTFSESTFLMEKNTVDINCGNLESRMIFITDGSVFTDSRLLLFENNLRITSSNVLQRMVSIDNSMTGINSQVVMDRNVMRQNLNGHIIFFIGSTMGGTGGSASFTNNEFHTGTSGTPIAWNANPAFTIADGGRLLLRCNTKNGVYYTPNSYARIVGSPTLYSCAAAERDVCVLEADCVLPFATAVSGSAPDCRCECIRSRETVGYYEPDCRPGPPKSTPTFTESASTSRSNSLTASTSPSSTDSASSSCSNSLTASRSPSSSFSSSMSSSGGSSSPSGTFSVSPTDTITPSTSSVPSESHSVASSGTLSVTASARLTISETRTPPPTPSRTRSASQTQAPTVTQTVTASALLTASATHARTQSQSDSMSVLLSTSASNIASQSTTPSASFDYFTLLLHNNTIGAASIQTIAATFNESNVEEDASVGQLEVHFKLGGDTIDTTVINLLSPRERVERCLKLNPVSYGEEDDLRVLQSYLGGENIELHIDGPAVGRIRFRPNATFRINEQVILNVSLRADCIATRRNSPNATITIPPNPIEDVPTLPQGVKDTAEAVGTTAAIAGGAMGSPLTASQLSRSSIIASIAECEPDDDGLGFGESPTSAAFGTDIQSFYLGAAVMNHIILAALFLLQLAFAAIWSRTKSVSFQHGLIVARCPSLMVFPALLLMEPTAMCAMVVILYGTPGQVALGVISLILCCCIPIATALYFRCRPFASEFLADYDSEANAVIAFMLGRAKWRDLDVADTSRIPGFTQRHRLFFEDFRETTRWFMTVEMAMCIACGIVEGIKLGAGQCDGVLIALCIAFAVYLVATVAIRPYCVPFLWWFAVVMTLVQLCGAIFMAIHMMGGVRDARIWAEWTSVINLWMLMFRAIFDLYPLFRKTRRQFAKIELAKKKQVPGAPYNNRGRAGTHFNLSEGVLKVADDKDLIGDHTAAVQVAEARDDSDDDSLLRGPPPEYEDDFYDGNAEEMEEFDQHVTNASIDSLLFGGAYAPHSDFARSPSIDSALRVSFSSQQQVSPQLLPSDIASGFEALRQLDEWSLCALLARRTRNNLSSASDAAARAVLNFVASHEAHHGAMVIRDVDARTPAAFMVQDKTTHRAVRESPHTEATPINFSFGGRESINGSFPAAPAVAKVDPDDGIIVTDSQRGSPSPEKIVVGQDTPRGELSTANSSPSVPANQLAERLPDRDLQFPTQASRAAFMDSLAQLRTDAVAALLLQRLRDRHESGANGASNSITRRSATVADAIVDNLEMVSSMSRDKNL